VVLQQVADHQQLARARGGRDRRFGLGRGRGQRLLHEAVLAGLRHTCGQLRMRGNGSRQHDRVELVVLQQPVELVGRTHARKRPRDALARRPV